MTDAGFAGQSLEQLLHAMAGPPSGPAAGTAAATATGMAAALTAKTARRSVRYVAEARTISAHADNLRDRAVQLAAADAEAVAVMVAGSGERNRAAGDAEGTNPAQHSQPADASKPPADPIATPREIRALAAEVAELAERLAGQGNPRLHADAITAERLAAAAVAGCDAIEASNRK